MIVHELGPLKNVYFPAGGQNIIRIFSVYFLKMYVELSESVAFSHKLRYFMDQMGDQMKISFEYF